MRFKLNPLECITSKILRTNSYFRAKSSSSGRTTCRRSEDDKRAPELMSGLKGLAEKLLTFTGINTCHIQLIALK